VFSARFEFQFSTEEQDAGAVGAIVNCCVMKMFLSGEFLQNSVLEGTSFDDERHLFVAA
jgi:hypothetical protein